MNNTHNILKNSINSTAIKLQQLLNEIFFKACVVGPVKYNVGERVYFNESGDLEKFG